MPVRTHDRSTFHMVHSVRLGTRELGSAILRLHAVMRAAAGARFVRRLNCPALSSCSFTTNPRIIKSATIDPTNADSVIE